MSSNSKKLIAAVEAGELTDPGAMTTTQDIAHAVEDSYSTVHKQLRTLADDGVIERKTFGNMEVWVVPDDGGNAPARTPMPTDTRDPDAGK
ncbi:MAG: winged helix-turn-helix domain-containing protein [Halovenus sp.]